MSDSFATPLGAAHEAYNNGALDTSVAASLLAIAEYLAVIAAGSPVSQFSTDIIRQQVGAPSDEFTCHCGDAHVDTCQSCGGTV